MRIGTIILFLSASLAIAACKKKAEAPSDTAPEPAAEPKKTDSLEPLPAPRDPRADGPERAPVPPPSNEGLGEATDDDAIAEAPEIEIKTGGTYAISQGDQIVVMNPKPVDDGLRRFAKGSTCRYDPEGTLKIIGKRRVKMDDAEHDEYLVRYTREPAAEELRPGALEHADAEPYECPNGTVFFIEDVTVLEPDEPDPRYEAARKLLNSEKP